MSELILMAIGIGLFIYGLDIALGEREILGFIRKAVNNRLEKLYKDGLISIWKIESKLWKPIILCPVCMSSLWGSSISAIFGYYWDSLLIVPMAAAVVMTLINFEKE